MFPPELAVTCFQVALKPFLTTLESLWNLTFRLLELLTILSGLVEPHFFIICLSSLSSTRTHSGITRMSSLTFNIVVAAGVMILNLEINKLQLDLASLRSGDWDGLVPVILKQSCKLAQAREIVAGQYLGSWRGSWET